MKVLGAPLGHPSFVQAFLVKKIEDQRTLQDPFNFACRFPSIMAASVALCSSEGELFVAGG